MHATLFYLRSCTERKICVVHENTGADFVWHWMPQSASLAGRDPCLGRGKVCTGSLVLLGSEHRHWELQAQSGMPTHTWQTALRLYPLEAWVPWQLIQPVLRGKAC